MAYAADGAAPGDALYNLDRSIEGLRLALTSDPQASFELELALASERLEEAKKALGEEKIDQFNEAMDDYDGAVRTIAGTFQSSAVVDKAILGELLDEAIASYDIQLADMVNGEREGDMVQKRDRDRGTWCLEGLQGEEHHPVAERLAEDHDVSYEEVIGWFCSGFGLGEIGLAYQIQSASGTPVDDLFGTRSDENMGWGLILQDKGLIGRPEGAGPAEDVRRGPPEGVPQGRPDDAGGPPDQPEGKGPPEGVPQGPPDRDGKSEEQGPPQGVPQGRPDEKGLPPGQAKEKP
jgi:hypothetical protein